jgi:hypothetical protein
VKGHAGVGQLERQDGRRNPRYFALSSIADLGKRRLGGPAWRRGEGS